MYVGVLYCNSYSIQFLESLPANLNSSMIKGHAGALSWQGRGLGAIVSLVCARSAAIWPRTTRSSSSLLSSLHCILILLQWSQENREQQGLPLFLLHPQPYSKNALRSESWSTYVVTLYVYLPGPIITVLVNVPLPPLPVHVLQELTGEGMRGCALAGKVLGGLL